MPEETGRTPEEGPRPRPDQPAEEKALPAPRVSRPLDMNQERSCLENLEELGAEFEKQDAVSDPAGCLIPHPVKLAGLGRGIKLEPAATLNCAQAEAVVRFAQSTLAPEARKAFGAELASVHQASAFVCRPRHGTSKISEHAYGNALDLSAFTLADGKTVEVGLHPEAKAASFLDTIRRAACGPFKTVLGPGSDADHETHLHLDLEPRRNGGTFCQ